jgi:hypothetical protein
MKCRGPCANLFPQEKEEFEERLRKRDEQRTRKVAEEQNQLSKAEQREEKKRK